MTTDPSSFSLIMTMKRYFEYCTHTRDSSQRNRDLATQALGNDVTRYDTRTVSYDSIGVENKGWL